MFTNPDIHPLGCRCACCQPYAPADSRTRHRLNAAILIAIGTALIVAATVLA